MNEDGKGPSFNQQPYKPGIDTHDPMQQIKAKHAEIKGKINDPFLKVGYAIPIATELQISPYQLGLSTVVADQHGRLWMEGNGGLVLIHDEGLHRMGGRLRGKIDTSDIPEAEEDWFRRAQQIGPHVFAPDPKDPLSCRRCARGSGSSLHISKVAADAADMVMSNNMAAEPVEWWSRRPMPPVRAWRYLGEICPPEYKAPPWLTAHPDFQYKNHPRVPGATPSPGDWIVMKYPLGGPPVLTLYTDEAFKTEFVPAAIQGRDASWQ